MSRAGLVLGAIGFFMTASACAPKWDSKLLVDSRQVAKALNDTASVGPAEAFDPTKVPNFDPPKKVRPCCAFGVDMKAEVGPVPVPLYENQNILGPEDIGPHGYDKGELTREHNGLVYTCRGGFIDIAHVRDNADRTLFMAMALVKFLPGGTTVMMPEEGTIRRVIVKPLPEGLLERHGRWNTAIAMSGWINFQLSNWHEVVTWYGWESTPGFSERLSAFSPEDAYSNVLGINIAAGIIANREMRSREQYDESMEAWIREALRRLGVVSKAQARAAMKAVDGLWWDSSKRLPEFALTRKRSLDFDTPVSGWIVADTLPKEKLTPEIAQMCPRQPPPLALVVPEKLGDVKMEELIEIQFEFASWVPDHFPLPAQKGKFVTQADLPAIIAAVREQGQRELGPDFEDPRAAPKQ